MGYVEEQWMLGDNPDPGRWEDVRTKAGWYRRRKRKKGSKINTVLQKNADRMGSTLQAVKRILDKLHPWVHNLELGTLRMKMSAKLRQRMAKEGKTDFMLMKDLDIQPWRPLNALLRAPYSVQVSKDEVVIKLDLRGQNLDLKNSIATDFYFDAVIIWGNPMLEKGLKVDGVESKLYPIENVKEKQCVLRLDLPVKREPWMVMLKVSCLEGNEIGVSPRLYGMKVVEVGV